MNEAKERFGLLIRPGLFILMAIFPCLLRKHAGRPNQQRSLELNVHYININSTFPLKKNFCAIAPIQEDQNHLQRALWRSVRIRGSSYERWRFSAFSPCKFLLHAHWKVLWKLTRARTRQLPRHWRRTTVTPDKSV